MKQDEMKPCSFCDKGVMHSGSPVFYRIKLDHMGVDIRAVQRQSGLEQMLGGGSGSAAVATVAFHMGLQEDIASVIISSEKIICHPCMLEKDIPLPMLIGD